MNWVFLLLDTHFLPEKKGFLWDTTQNTEISQKNKLRIVAKPKSTMWLFLLLKVRPPPPWCIQWHTQLLSLNLELVETPLSRPSLPCCKGWDEMVWLKTQIRLRNIVHPSCLLCIELTMDNSRNIMPLCQCRWPPHSQFKGWGTIHMPWAIPLWRGLVQLCSRPSGPKPEIWGQLNVHCVGSYYSNWILFLVMFLHVPSIDSTCFLCR